MASYKGLYLFKGSLERGAKTAGCEGFFHSADPIVISATQHLRISDLGLQFFSF